MKIKLLLLVLAIPFVAFTQVGIGTVSLTADVALEIASDNAGVLLPRIGLQSQTDVKTIENPTKSLLVYNSNTSATNLSEGFVYWDGAKWVPIFNSGLKSMTRLKMNDLTMQSDVAYDLPDNYDLVIIDAYQRGNLRYTLPEPSTVPVGKEIIIKNISDTQIKVYGHYNGVNSNYDLNENTSVIAVNFRASSTFISDGTQWLRIAESTQS